jgi:hypothetical protein
VSVRRVAVSSTDWLDGFVVPFGETLSLEILWYPATGGFVSD